MKKGQAFFIQVKNQLQAAIDAGLYKPGEKIPTETELIAKYKTSITTIRKAVQDLCNDGVLLKHQGCGTFVREVRKKIGLVTPYIGDSWAPFWNGLKEASKQHSLILKIYPYTWTDSNDFLENLELCAEENSGAIIFPPYYACNHTSEKILDLQFNKYPMVFVEKEIYPLINGINSVMVDYFSGFDKFIASLKKEYQRIGVIVDPSHSSGPGLLKACRKHDLDGQYVKTGGIFDNKNELKQAIDSLLDLDTPPEIIVCFSSSMVIEVYRYLKSKGLKVPDDIALTGAGNISSLSNIMVPMKALEFPRKDMGIETGRIIAELLKNPNAENNISFKAKGVELK